MKDDEEYRVCWNLSKKVQRYLIANPERRKRVLAINLENIKRIKILVGGDDITSVDLDCLKSKRQTKSEVMCQSLKKKGSKISVSV